MEKFPDSLPSSDLAKIAAKGLVGAIPVFGSVFAETLGYGLDSKLRKRQMDWFQSVADELERLAEQMAQCSPDRLLESDQFVDAVMAAARTAQLTSDRDKLAALRNAVMNVALRGGAVADRQDLLFACIEDLTASHLQLLLFFDGPREAFAVSKINWPNLSMGGLAQLIDLLHPEWPEDFVKQLVRDLYGRGLINTDSIGTTMSSAGLEARRSTELGRELLLLVRQPPL